MEGSQLPTATGNVTRSSPRTPGTATASNSQEPQPLGGVLRGLIPRTFEKLFQDINHSEVKFFFLLLSAVTLIYVLSHGVFFRSTSALALKRCDLQLLSLQCTVT